MGICNPVHYCVNAFLATHKCTFAICSKCKNNLEEHEYLLQGSAKRTRRALHNTSKRANSAAGLKEALNKKYQNRIGGKKKIPEGQCDEDYDHDCRNLKSTCDDSYFDSAFLKQVKKSNRPFPTKCRNCDAEFRKK